MYEPCVQKENGKGWCEPMHKILVINPGSTSTKVALYDDEKQVVVKSIEHETELLVKYPLITDQYEFRNEAIMRFLEENNTPKETLSAVVGRGGGLPPVKSGAYMVNEKMMAHLKKNPESSHASNLGGILAYEIAKPLGIPAYIYDSISVDELDDVARISGMPALPRKSFSHVLNSRATAMKVAAKMGKPYDELNMIVAHLGGGISMSAHKQGRMVDIVGDDEGPFSPERSGAVPVKDLIALCFSGKYTEKEMKQMARGNGGFKAYLGTVDGREVDKMIKAGDEKAKLVFDAMGYQIAKGIGSLATVLCGKVDAIVITGGLAHQKALTDYITQHVSFIAPVEVVPGENEMEALAHGALRVLTGKETAHEFE